MQKTTGQKDPIMRLLRELQGEDGRRRERKFLVEGEELVRRAFDFGGGVLSLIFTEAFAATDAGQGLAQRAAAALVESYTATEGLFGKILEAKPIPECIAVVERRVTPLDDALAGERPLVMMVERSENADNLGMLLRSTDAGGVTGVVLAADTTDPFSRRVVRGSRGAIFTVPICIRNDCLGAIREAANRGIQVIATSANAQRVYTDIDFTKPSMIIVGNEHVGISRSVRDISDALVRIPMFGKINSLNIAVAASIMIYEAARQRREL